MVWHYFQFLHGLMLGAMFVGLLHWGVFMFLIFALRDVHPCYTIKKDPPTFPIELRKILSSDELRKTETCQWFNELVASVLRDHIGLDHLADRLKDKLNVIFAELQQDIKLVVDKLEVTTISFGDIMPKITRIDTRNYDIANNGDIILDADLVYDGCLKMEVIADLFFKKRVHISAVLDRIMGRLIIEFSDTTLTVFFQEDPLVDMRISMELGNMSLERIGALMTSKVKNAISKECVYPNVQAFYYQRQKHSKGDGYTYKSKKQVHTAIKPGTLRLTILGASGLQNSVSSWRRKLRLVDPYCVVSLNDFKHKTKPCLKTNEPVWNETIDIDLLHLQRRLTKQSTRKDKSSQQQQQQQQRSSELSASSLSIGDTASTTTSLNDTSSTDLFTSKDHFLYLALFDKRKGRCLGCAYISLADLPKNVLRNETLSLIPQRQHTTADDLLSGDEGDDPLLPEELSEDKSGFLATNISASSSPSSTALFVDGSPSMGELRIEYLLVMPETTTRSDSNSGTSFSGRSVHSLSTASAAAAAASQQRLTQRRSATGMSADLEVNLKAIEAWNKLDEEEESVLRRADTDFQPYRREASQRSRPAVDDTGETDNANSQRPAPSALPMEYMELEIVTKLIENETQTLIGAKKRQLEGTLSVDEATALIADCQVRLAGYQAEESLLKEALQQTLGWRDPGSKERPEGNVAMATAAVIPITRTLAARKVTGATRKQLSCRAGGFLAGVLTLCEQGLLFRYHRTELEPLLKQGVLTLKEKRAPLFCQLLQDRLLIYEDEKRAHAREVIRLDDVRGVSLSPTELTVLLMSDKSMVFQGAAAELSAWHTVLTIASWLSTQALEDLVSSEDGLGLIHHGNRYCSSVSAESLSQYMALSERQRNGVEDATRTAVVEYVDVIAVEMVLETERGEDMMGVQGGGEPSVYLNVKNVYGYPLVLQFVAEAVEVVAVEKMCSHIYNQWKNTLPSPMKKYAENASSRKECSQLAKQESKLYRIFKIPEDESKVSEFQCALWKGTKMSTTGNLYITDHYLCFTYKSLLKQNKVMIPMVTLRETRTEEVGGELGITVVSDVTQVSFGGFDSQDTVAVVQNEIQQRMDASLNKLEDDQNGDVL